MACPLASERVWLEKSRYAEAEREYYERLSQLLKGSVNTNVIDTTELKVIHKGKMAPQSNKVETKKSVGGNDTSPTPSVSFKTKKAKKVKVVTDSSVVVVEMSVPHENNSANEETKTKKKKKKKNTNKEAGINKSIENNQKENVPPLVAEVCDTPITMCIENIVSVNEDSKAKKKNKKKQHNKETTADNAQKDIATQSGDVDLKNNQFVLQDTTENEGQTAKKNKNAKNKSSGSNQCTLVSEIAKARQHIKNSLEKMDGIASLAASPASAEVLDRLAIVEKENSALHLLVEKLSKTCLDSEKRLKSLEDKLASLTVSGQSASAPVPAAADDDDGVDLFASESEDEDADAARIREERLAAYAAKKSKKPALIAKSSLVLDVKPWDDETDLKVMEVAIRKIATDGLLWGAGKFVPVAFGIQKLSISCVVEDEKVSIDWLTEEIEKFEDFVQSVDVAAFNKI